MATRTIKIESAELSEGKLHVNGRLTVTSTGWSVSHTIGTNSEGKIVAIHLTPVEPPHGAMVGCGFPSDGQEFDITIRGNFASVVNIFYNKTILLEVACSS